MESIEKTKYEDIIHLPHHVSTEHPPMAVADRAAQFSPFAALTGYDSAILETQRQTETFMELDENRKEILNAKLQKIHKQTSPPFTVAITYFKPDIRKEGGEYKTCTGVVKKIDTYEHRLLMQGGEEIPIEHIYEIEFLL